MQKSNSIGSINNKVNQNMRLVACKINKNQINPQFLKNAKNNNNVIVNENENPNILKNKKVGIKDHKQLKQESPMKHSQFTNDFLINEFQENLSIVETELNHSILIQNNQYEFQGTIQNILEQQRKILDFFYNIEQNYKAEIKALTDRVQELEQKQQNIEIRIDQNYSNNDQQYLINQLSDKNSKHFPSVSSEKTPQNNINSQVQSDKNFKIDHQSQLTNFEQFKSAQIFLNQDLKLRDQTKVSDFDKNFVDEENNYKQTLLEEIKKNFQIGKINEAFGIALSQKENFHLIELLKINCIHQLLLNINRVIQQYNLKNAFFFLFIQLLKGLNEECLQKLNNTYFEFFVTRLRNLLQSQNDIQISLSITWMEKCIKSRDITLQGQKQILQSINQFHEQKYKLKDQKIIFILHSLQSYLQQVNIS